jgi:hypothetical protein
MPARWNATGMGERHGVGPPNEHNRGFAQLQKTTTFIGYGGADYSGRFLREGFASDGCACYCFERHVMR